MQNARRMTSRIAFVLSLLFVSAAAFAQGISGTTVTAGPDFSPWVDHGALFYGFDVHITHANEVGPDEPRNEFYSTNWLGLGAMHYFGHAFVLARGRVSLEPYTIPDNDGYPQTLQYVSPESGGPLVDRMRPHDLVGEAAVQAGYNFGDKALLSVYAGLVGDPALGPAPAELRASGIDFPEAPFSYDISESWHDSTKVVSACLNLKWISIDASAFHDAVTFGDHTDIPDGDIDSSSARVTLTPVPSVALQVSRGTLGEDANERKVSSASLSYNKDAVAVTAMWTRREREALPTETAYGFELALRGSRNTFMGRAEWVDRPAGFPETLNPATLEQTTHFAVGYIFDFLAPKHYRAGAGVTIDYHTQSHELPERYGHKPQTVYAFVRLRTK